MEEQARVARFYDELGIKEWLRLDENPRARVVLHMHKQVLRRIVRSGDRVLDAGCGPGRFASELVRLGARLIAGDISFSQLALAGNRAGSFPKDSRRDLALLTVTSLPFADACFDATVCFGSILSHLGSQAEAGLRELVRVTRIGGCVLISVQSSQNYYLPYILDQVSKVGLESVDRAMMMGTEIAGASHIPWRAFSHAEIESLAARLDCDAMAISASNVLATVDSIPLLETMEKDESLWRAFLRWEEHLGRQRGNTERGSHMIAVLRKRA